MTSPALRHVDAGSLVRPVGAPKAGRPRDERATEAIVAAALRQLHAEGYAHMSMDSVAEEAGVARATVYRRYRSKADLVTTALAAGRSTAAGTPADTTPHTPADALSEVIAFLEELDAAFAEPCLEVIGCLLGAREEPLAMALHRERVVAPRTAAFRALLERAQAEGFLRRDADIDLVLQMLLGAVFARRIAGITANRSWARHAAESLLEGIGSRTRPS